MGPRESSCRARRLLVCVYERVILQWIHNQLEYAKRAVRLRADICGMEYQQQVVSVGIDMAKEKFDAALLYEDNGSSVGTFENSPDGIGKFIGLLKAQRTAETVPCVVESTGLYHVAPALMIRQAGYRVNVINPLITKKYQRSSVRNAKTDTIDALRLAEIGIREADLPLFSGDIRSLEARKLASYCGKLEDTKRSLKASMKQVEQLQAITGMEMDLDHTKKALTALDEQIALLQERICEMAPKEAAVLAEQTKGISKEKLSIVLSMLADKQFANRDQLVAFVGLDVMPRQSGTWRGKGKLSKRGSPYLRKVLHHIAWGLQKHNPTYQAEYKRLRDNGKGYRQTLIILARKFLRFLYAYYWKNGGCPQMKI